MYASRSHTWLCRPYCQSAPALCAPNRPRQSHGGAEFGAKLTVSLVESYAEVTMLSWDAYNESQDLIKVTEAYKMRYCHYPRRILADSIFRTRHNRRYCKARGIHLNGPPLSRPPKDRTAPTTRVARILMAMFIPLVRKKEHQL